MAGLWGRDPVLGLSLLIQWLNSFVLYAAHECLVCKYILGVWFGAVVSPHPHDILSHSSTIESKLFM